LMITGNGLKDSASLESWNDKPTVFSPGELREKFGIN
jgi:hypothetical protein